MWKEEDGIASSLCIVLSHPHFSLYNICYPNSHRFCNKPSFLPRIGIMFEGRGSVEDTDMPLNLQIQAMSCASAALDLHDVIDFKSIATHIKKEFDNKYGGGWQCIVGSNFGCFFTHSKGTFIYFKMETLKFLIFKGDSY